MYDAAQWLQLLDSIVLNHCNTLKGRQFIAAGDFNLVLREADGGVSTSEQSIEEFRTACTQTRLRSVQLDLHPRLVGSGDGYTYSWMGQGGARSCIDHILTAPGTALQFSIHEVDGRSYCRRRQ